MALKKKSKKIDHAVRHMLAKHRDKDKKGENDASIRKREEKQVENLLRASEEIDRFLKR